MDKVSKINEGLWRKILIEHIYEKASQILNVDKNKIDIEVHSKLKTIFADKINLK